MPKETQTGPNQSFTTRRLPWILGGAMLLVYLATLNHWVTLANLMPVAQVSGLVWQPTLYQPLMFLVTAPFRVLPASLVPLALNLFSALCAALTLVLLARSVAILPQDRTEAQRLRERSDFAYLTTRNAWFPPLFAVVMFGMEFGFWKFATSFSAESVDILLFAAILWLLLEFRLDERPGRLTLAALLFGMGMTENWGMIGFLPLFITAIIWLKGLEFFNLRFLGRMLLSGLAGLLLFLLLPAVGIFSSEVHMTFWQMLKPAWQLDWQVIQAITVGPVQHNLLLMAVTVFLPLLVMAIRWSASFGDSSHAGKLLAGQMFHFIHAVIFGVCMWLMFDPPFSPAELAMGYSALTFYYLSALALGYYCGYFLLVFGKRAVPSRRNPRPDTALPKALDGIFRPLIHWGTYALACFVALTLMYKNLPLIRACNDNTLARYAKQVVGLLPKSGGILLNDSVGIAASPQARGLLVQEELARTGRAKDFLVVDTQSLNWAPYFHYLHAKAPDKWPAIPGDQKMAEVKQLGILSVLNEVAQSNTLCYLNPSFGYYFELFYQEPHGLVYEMKKLPDSTLLPPPLSTRLIAENQDFWKQAGEQEFPRIEKAIAPARQKPPTNPLKWLIGRLHGQAEVNPNAVFVGGLYSRSLDWWGVALQRDGQLPAAAECFTNALKINPDNVVAAINLDFNHTLQAGTPATIDPERVNTDEFGKSRNWNAVLNANGPFDEPSFLYVNSVLIARSGLMRQSVEPFTRLRELVPDSLPVRFWLAQIYLYNRLPDRALEALHGPLSQPKRFGLDETNSSSLNMLAAYAYFQKNEVSRGVGLVERELARHPDDTNLVASAAQVFFGRGLYTNALHLINQQLVRTPNAPEWLFGKGYASLQLSNYDQAISALTRVLDISTNDPNARFNRALAYLRENQLDKARADYLALQTIYTNSPQVAYGLAEVAWRQHETNEAVHNYELFLAHAPTNAVEIPKVRERLAQLQKK